MLKNLNNKEKQIMISYVFAQRLCQGPLEYANDLLKIKETIKNNYGIDIGLSEAQDFWEWRSNLWDANFLSIHNEKEIIEYFDEFINNFYEDFNKDEIEYILRLNKDKD